MLDTLKNAFIKLDKYNHRILDIYLIINVVWLFLGMFFYNYFRFSYQNFSTSLVLLFIINFMIIVYVNIRRKVNFDKIDIFLILLIVLGMISTIFSKNISVSLYGTWKRYEGLFQLFYYYSLFYLSTLCKNKRLIVKFILFFGLMNVFVTFLQIFDVFKFIPINNKGTALGQGFITNSNFFGSYMVLCLGLSIGLFLYFNGSKLKNILYLVLALCFYAGLLFSNAMSGMVGLFGICFLIFIYFIYNLFKKKIVFFDVMKHIILLVCCIVLSVVLTIYNKTMMFDDVKRYFFETQQMVNDINSGNEISDEYGNSRLFIWKRTLNSFPKYWLHGVGVDCFLYIEEFAISLKLPTNEIMYFDKAHNEYLQKMICEGIFSLVVYLFFLFIIFISSLKKIFKGDNILYLFFSFVGYSIQAFFNISVIEVAPLFFIVIGLLYNRKCKV